MSQRVPDRVFNIITVVAYSAAALIAVVVTWLIVTGNGDVLDGGDDGPNLQKAADDCAQPDFDLSTGDEGKSIHVVVGGEGTNVANVEDADLALTCLLDELDTPDSTRSKIQSTTAVQGRQEDSWGDYEASWTYHPDNGLDLIIEEK